MKGDVFMRASEATYEKVAENCSAFDPKREDKTTTTNSTCEHCCCKVSCTTCKHFDSDEHCVLDLYDKIVKDHNLK